MPYHDCERLISVDSEARRQRFALSDIENYALARGLWAIARMAREARGIPPIDNSVTAAIIPSGDQP